MSRIQPSVSRIRPLAPLTLDDLRRRATARVAERIDMTRSRHKPLSLMRMEARRIIEQYLEVEAATLSRSDREKLTEEILSDVAGLGPLEELFRDEAVQEIMVLAFNQVIVRKADSWIPTSVQFRDAEQYRALLLKMAIQGESLTSNDATTPPIGEPSAICVRLQNGFRVLAVLPPGVLEQAPFCVFMRGALPVTEIVMTPAPRSIPANPSLSRASVTDSSVAGKTRMSESLATKIPSGPIPVPASRQPVGSDSTAHSRPTDPFDRLRQRVTERMISRLAAAGVYDISQLPKAELQRVIGLYVEEITTADKIYLDPATRSRLTLEIISAMNR